jgi:hypothetical protein
MKKLPLIFLLTFSTFSYVFCQKIREYISTDSSLWQGSVTPLKGERIEFRTASKDTPTVYGIDQIREYAYEGAIYRSRVIDGQKKFIRLIARGTMNLYEVKRRFALEVDSNLVVVNRANYRTIITENSKLEEKESIINRLTYTQTSLRNFVNAYNQDDKRKLKQLPYRKVGAYIGYSLMRFNTTFKTSGPLQDKTGFLTAGVFYDAPLFNPRSLYLTLDLGWLHAEPLFYYKKENNANYLALDINALNAMPGIKWILNKSKVKIYLRAGGLLSGQLIASPTGLLEATRSGSIIETTKQDVPRVALLYGFMSGAGVQIPYSKRKNVHLEVKWMQSLDKDLRELSLDFSVISFNTGFNI